jgi:hypothetical protein
MIDLTEITQSNFTTIISNITGQVSASEDEASWLMFVFGGGVALLCLCLALIVGIIVWRKRDDSASDASDTMQSSRSLRTDNDDDDDNYAALPSAASVDTSYGVLSAVPLGDDGYTGLAVAPPANYVSSSALPAPGAYASPRLSSTYTAVEKPSQYTNIEPMATTD